MLHLKASCTFEVVPKPKHCWVEVAAGEGIVRVYQQSAQDSVTTTPTSVLQTAQAFESQRTYQAPVPLKFAEGATRHCSRIV